MIFLTVGSQMPFDRLVRAVDSWAQKNTEVEVFGQIGDAAYVPSAMQWAKVLAPDDYLRRVGGCDFLIGHAGMGTVITAAEYAKPLLVMPRRGALRETRNDHQVATAKWLGDRAGIWVAADENEVGPMLDKMLSAVGPLAIAKAAADEMIIAVRRFIEA